MSFSQEQLSKLVGRTVEFVYVDSNTGLPTHRQVVVEVVKENLLTGVEMSKGYVPAEPPKHKSFKFEKMSEFNIM